MYLQQFNQITHLQSFLFQQLHPIMICIMISGHNSNEKPFKI